MLPRRGLGALLTGLLLVVPVGVTGTSPRAHEVDDPVFVQGLQWGLDVIGAPGAWATGTGAGKTIAIVDSGADLDHEDLREKIVGSVSCIGADGDPNRCHGSAQDDVGHGTHVAGIAAAATDNGHGIAGVAPDADLLIVRVLSSSCDRSDECTATGTPADVAAGIRWATEHGADVINLSLGGGSFGSDAGCALCDAVEEAWQAGAIPVIAAGNDAALPTSFAEEPIVIVTATTRDDRLASYAGAAGTLPRGARWPVAAPGGEGETDPGACGTGGRPDGIISTFWTRGEQDQYACLAGTSMAAPHVSGALAILLGTGLTPGQAIDRLLSSARDLGPAGRDDQFGHGRIDLQAALDPATPTTSTAPSVTPSTAAPARAANDGSPAPLSAAPYTDTSASHEVPPWLAAIAIVLVTAVALGLGLNAGRLRR